MSTKTMMGRGVWFRGRALGVVLVGLSVFAPGAAQAAPTWLAPQQLGITGQTRGQTDTRNRGADHAEVISPQGDSLAVWTGTDGTNSVIRAAMRPAGGVWSEPQVISVAGQNAFKVQVEMDSAGNAISVWTRYDGSNWIVQAATLPVGGSWSLPQDLSAAGQDANSPQVAFDPNGNAMAIWTRYNVSKALGGKEIVQAVSRPLGGPWGTPQDVSATGADAVPASSPQVALDAQGNAVAIWQRPAAHADDFIPQAATHGVGASQWSTPQDLSGPEPAPSGGRVEPNYDGPQVAVGPQGDAVAVWRHWNGSEHVIETATLPAQASRWSAPQNLSAVTTGLGSTGEGGTQGSAPQISVDAKGNALAVWYAATSVSLGGAFTSVIQTTSRPAGGSWGPAQDLTSPAQTAINVELATNARGDAVAVWQRIESTGLQTANWFVVAASRPAGGPWGVGQNLSPDPNPRSAYPWPRVAIDPQGNATAGWAFGDGTTASFRAAGFDAAGPQLRGLSVPGGGATGSPLSFAVSPVDVWSSVALTHWDFGDGTSADGMSVSHAYSAPGSYEVTVTSKDALDNASSEKRTVVITAAPAADPPPTAPGTAPVGETAPAPVPAGAGTGAGSTGATATTTVTMPGSAFTGPAPAAGGGGTPSVIERSALSRCLARARRLTTARAQSRARAACARPGRVGGLKARARSSRAVKLSFLAPGSLGRFAPAARRYVVKQSLKPIRSERSFRAATTLCRRSCSFAPTRVGQNLELTITGLQPRTTYYYAIKAVGAAQRTGPRSVVVKVTTQ